jgi:hypothetical protein
MQWVSCCDRANLEKWCSFGVQGYVEPKQNLNELQLWGLEKGLARNSNTQTSKAVAHMKAAAYAHALLLVVAPMYVDMLYCKL